ncbi:MAG: hypothetical protein ACAH95_14465 [Fimbriimonas sp.]
MTANRMFRYSIACAALGMVLFGCGKSAPPSYPTWATAPQPTAIQANSSNAFDAYRQAALDAEEKGQKYLTRVSFFPGHRKIAAELTQSAFVRVIQATGRESEFKFTPTRPFEQRPFHRGWRLLGRVFAWKIEDACKAEDYANAVMLANAGSKFGFDLTGGAAMDAALGLDIVDQIRIAIAPHLTKMKPEQLSALASGMTSALGRKVPLTTTLTNEEQNFKLAVQTVQDLYRANDLKKLEDELGPSGREAVEKLKAAGKKSDEARLQYFSGFANEASESVHHYVELASLPVAKREAKLEFSRNRAWRGFAKIFLGTLEPLLSHDDATTARTRLVILQAKLLAGKKNGYPSSLKYISQELDKDPYSGERFLYHYDASQFTLYSVGPNLKDDGGETDGTFSDPDLLLEQG